jgi:hypothetical protein
MLRTTPPVARASRASALEQASALAIEGTTFLAGDATSPPIYMREDAMQVPCVAIAPPVLEVVAPPLALPGSRDQYSYLGSYRALAACTREFGRLAEEMLHEVKALHAEGVFEKPEVRTSPDRCILQVGPVALTLTWLRQTIDSAAEGELLIVVWRGIVAPSLTHRPERLLAKRTRVTASALWEEVLIAEATNEASWVWRQPGSDIAGVASRELAVRTVNRLQIAHAESLDAV